MLKENIILSSPKVPASFEFSLKATGLIPRINDNGILEFIGRNGEVKAHVPKPFMEDAEGAISETVAAIYDIRENGKVQITYTPDRAWLEDSARKYPVILDPGTVLKDMGTEKDAWIDEYAHAQAKGALNPEYLRLGVFKNLFISRSWLWVLLDFDLSSLPVNTYVHNASISMYCTRADGDRTRSYDIDVVPYSQPWNENTVTWDSVGLTSTPDNDFLVQYLPNSPSVSGVPWDAQIDPAVVSGMVKNPQNSMLIWTDYPDGDYERRFNSKEAAVDSGLKPKLTVFFSHVPEIQLSSQQTGHVAPENLAYLGVKDKLCYRIEWDTIVPMANGTYSPHTSIGGAYLDRLRMNYLTEYSADSLPENCGWEWEDNSPTPGIADVSDGILRIKGRDYWQTGQTSGIGKTVHIRVKQAPFLNWYLYVSDGQYEFRLTGEMIGESILVEWHEFQDIVVALKEGKATVYRNGLCFGQYSAVSSVKNEVRFGVNYPLMGFEPLRIEIDFVNWGYGVPTEHEGILQTQPGTHHIVEFGKTTLKPYRNYTVDLVAWCAIPNDTCYVNNDSHTVGQLGEISFDTNLSVSNFDFSNNPNNAVKFPDWGWQPLTDGHIAPRAYPNGLSCIIRYSTDTVTRGKVVFWEKANPQTREVLESSTANGFLHEITLDTLKYNTTYEYQVTSTFTADQVYIITSAKGEFTTTDIICTGFNETTRESNEPLTEATVTWQAALAESPDTPMSVTCYLYLGTTLDRTTAELYDLKIPATRDGFIQTAVVSNLSPGITYYYRVGAEGTSTVYPLIGQPARAFVTPMAGRGAESYYNIVWRDLGVNGKLGVNTADGNFVAAKAFFALAGRGPGLAVGCFYNGNSNVNESSIGTGWRMSYESSILTDANGWVVQTHDDGSVHIFKKNAAGGFDSAPGQFGVLESTADGHKITYKDGSSLVYRNSGGKSRLIEAKDRRNNAVFINRDVLGRISTLRRSAAAPDTAEVTFYYNATTGCLDYILTKQDPATGKQYKVDFDVTKDSMGTWEELKFTQLYQHGEGITPEAYWTTYHLGIPNGPAYIQDPNGHRTNVNYWPDHRVNTFSAGYTAYNESGGIELGASTLTLSYSAGYRTNVIDARGNTIVFTHNPNLSIYIADLPADEKGLKAQKRFTYDSNFQVTETQSSKSQSTKVFTRYQYDSNGNVERIIEDCGGSDSRTRDNTTVLTYEPKYNQIKTVTDPRQYNLNPNLISTEYVYDPVAGTLESIEPRGDGALEPANYRIEYDYYANYDLKLKRVCNTNSTYVNALPTVTYEYGYDNFGQLEEVLYLDGSQRKLIGFYRRDMFGNLLYRVDANGTIIQTEYNKRLLPTGQKRPMKIDATTLAAVNTRLAYFGYWLQPLSEAELPEPTPDFTYSQRMTYDALGRANAVTDARENTTTNEYDELSRLRKVTAPLNLTAYYHYDGNGNLEWKRYSVQNGYVVVRHFYDALNRETSSFDPAISREREFKAEFDLAGNTEVLYRGWNSDGTFMSKEVYAYDNLNRCTEVRYYDAANVLKKLVSKEYDRNGNTTKVISPVFGPVGVNDGTLVRTQSFDAINRLVSETVTNSINSNYNYSASYEYGGGRLLSETLIGVTTNYTYDSGGRMATLNGNNKTFTFGYYPNGARRQLQYGINGSTFMTATYGFDRAYRLLSLSYAWGAGSQMSFTHTYYEDGKIHTATEAGSGATVTGLTFVDDADVALGDDDPLSEDEATKFAYPSPNQLFGGTRSATYAYDALGRLTQAILPRYCNGVPESTTAWGYDAMGNRTSESIVEGSYKKNSSTTITSTTITSNYTFDPLSGNRTVSGTRTVARDIIPSNDSQTITMNLTYSYDEIGNLISQTGSSSAFNELWRVASHTSSDQTVSYYYDGNGDRLREDNQYHFYNSNGVGRVVEGATSTSHDYIKMGGQLLASSDGFFYIVNTRGDVVALISDASGCVLGYYVYDSYGGVRAAQKDPNLFNRFKFAGGLQSITGNYIFGARSYSPTEGRWISGDSYRGTLDDPLSLNRYAYCNNDPINFVDPTGFVNYEIGSYTFTPLTAIVWNAYIWVRNFVGGAVGGWVITGSFTNPLAAKLAGSALGSLSGAFKSDYYVESTDRIVCYFDTSTFTWHYVIYNMFDEIKYEWWSALWMVPDIQGWLTTLYKRFGKIIGEHFGKELSKYGVGSGDLQFTEQC